jgi:hypothetical protein
LHTRVVVVIIWGGGKKFFSHINEYYHVIDKEFIGFDNDKNL